ncbi:hypothetical protein, partial [Hymenobacter segetis]
MAVWATVPVNNSSPNTSVLVWQTNVRVVEGGEYTFYAEMQDLMADYTSGCPVLSPGVQAPTFEMRVNSLPVTRTNFNTAKYTALSPGIATFQIYISAFNGPLNTPYYYPQSFPTSPRTMNCLVGIDNVRIQ